MISKSSKFPTRTQFLDFRAKAKQFTTPHLRILVDKHSPLPTSHMSPLPLSRLSVIVPVKVNKRTVARNAFKRLVYDQTWKIIKDKNLDCIVMFKPIALPKGKISEDLIKNEISQNPSLF